MEQSFSLQHTDDQLKAIISKGKKLNLDDAIIDDLLFHSCKDAKRKTASVLIQNMDNWVNVVKNRGYPYLFASIDEFARFGDVLKNNATNWGLLSDKFHVQGSTLKNSNISEIGDIDIAYRVDINSFDDLVQRFVDATTNPATKEAIQNDAVKGIIRGYNMYLNPQTAGSFTGKFYSSFKSSFNSEFIDYFKVDKIQISIINENGKLDVRPFLKIN